MQFYNYLIEQAKADGAEKIVAGGIVLNKQGKILIMTRKPKDFLGGIDELPSGNLEKGETILQGMTREIKEETGMDIGEVKCYLDYFDYLSRNGKKTRQFNFVIIPTNDEKVILTEHTAYKWQTADEALNNDKITGKVKRSIAIYKFNAQR